MTGLALLGLLASVAWAFDVLDAYRPAYEPTPIPAGAVKLALVCVMALGIGVWHRELSRS